MAGEIIVVPFHDVGHIFPGTELSRHLASCGHRVTLFLPPSAKSPPVHPLITIMESNPAPPRPPPPPEQPQSAPRHRPHFRRHRDYSSLEDYLLSRRPKEGKLDTSTSDSNSDSDSAASPPIICAIVDVMMSHLIDTCANHDIPVVSFFTSSACSAALEHAMFQLMRQRPSSDLKPDDLVPIPGLPQEMALTARTLRRRSRRPPSPPPESAADDTSPPPPPPVGPGGHRSPPPEEGHQRGERRRPSGGPPRRGIMETTGSIALVFNTCEDLERPFLEYISAQTQKPVWGVGPLLPAQFWSSAESPVTDEEARVSKRETNVSEDEVWRWLDSKPRHSVLYISFGTRVDPSYSEITELAAALAESDRPFIWVLQARSVVGPTEFLDDLALRAGDRGLVIRGWAPQLLILSHSSTGGFLTHCGWNSTMEALGCGLPMLTWPVQGDQIHNAKLVTKWLKVGRSIRGSAAGSDAEVTRGDVTDGIEELMKDEGIRARAESVRSIFGGGFPKCSMDSLEALVEFLQTRK